MAGWYEPIKGKCRWWREAIHEDDAHNIMVKESEKRVQCVCMIEGMAWECTVEETPLDCPEARKCRYYIKSG